MVKYNLFVLSMVLLATIPARISGRSMDTTMIKREDGMETRAAAVATGGVGDVLRSYNGCSPNRKPINGITDLFCCDKDKQCWASLQECMPNCPCKANC